MSFESSRRRLGWVAAAAFVVAATAGVATAAPQPKQFVFTTKSKDAERYARDVVRAIETFQFGTATVDLANKAIAADPDFAFGHYLVATFSQTPEAVKAESDKAVALAKTASDGERRYIEAVLLVRANEPAKALPILTELSAQYPDERMVYMMLGQVQMNAGDLAAAETAFT